MKSKSLTILFIITQSEMGGAQRFMLECASALDRSQFTPHIAAGPAAYSKHTTGNRWELLNHADEAGITTHRLASLTRDKLPSWRWVRAVRDLRRLIGTVQPDILFLNSSSAGFLGGFAARSFDIPVVYRIGGWSFNDPRPWWQRQLFLAGERLSARWKDIIVVNSDPDRKQAERLGITPRKRIVTISNGLDADTIDFMDRAEARQNLITYADADLDDAFLIGNVANFYPSKAHDTLLRAFQNLQEKMQGTRHKNTKLILIGDGLLRPKIEQLRRELDLEDSVLLAGQIPGARRYLKALDLFVLSSKKEGFPWTILEAAAAGLPIVATDVSGVPDFVKDPSTSSGQATGLLVKPGNPDALADAMEHMVADPDLRARTAAGAERMLREHFSKDAMVQKFEGIFHELNA